MTPAARLALVGDYNSTVTAHQAIPLAIDLTSSYLNVPVAAEWVPTASISSAARDLAPYSGVWCVPASPYQNAEGALDAIQWARERKVPFLGTCGGFQHALIEYARNELRMADVAHAEENPGDANPLIALLACSLVEAQGEVLLTPGSRLHRSYGTLRIREGYRCNYGPNPEREASLFAGKLRVTARDEAGEVRGGELDDHPFFVGVLFQPERRALKHELPPLVRDFVAAIAQYQAQA